jgi:hypothetical protein
LDSSVRLKPVATKDASSELKARDELQREVDDDKEILDILAISLATPTNQQVSGYCSKRQSIITIDYHEQNIGNAESIHEHRSNNRSQAHQTISDVLSCLLSGGGRGRAADQKQTTKDNTG